MRYVLWGIISLSSALVEAGPRPPEAIQFAVSAFTKVLKECPERIWPSVSWSSQRFIFISPSSRVVWIFDGSNPLMTMALKKLPTDLLTDSFLISKGAISINVDEFNEDATEPMRVAVHELFHQLGQSNWKMKGTPSAPVFPLDVEARVLRAQLLESLKEVAVGKPSLGKAAYWYRSWNRQYPDESASTTDQNEGTAKYVERRLLALEKNGCSASSEELWSFDREWINRSYLNSERGLSVEGYVLGAVAGLILDLRGEDWKPRMTEGLSPLDVLLASQTEAIATEDPSIKRRLNRLVKDTNDFLANTLAPVMQKLDNNHILRLGIPVPWTAETEVHDGDFIARTDRSLLMSIFPPQAFKGDNGHIQILKPLVAFSLIGKTGPCQQTNYYLPVDGSVVRERAGQFEVRTSTVSATLRGQRVVREGIVYVCPTP